MNRTLAAIIAAGTTAIVLPLAPLLHPNVWTGPPPPPSATWGQPAEDDPQWNCLTMGNLTCGEAYTPYPSGVYETVGEDVVEHFDCLIGPDGRIVCPDGFVGQP
jgi:hypothetical protein